MSSKYIIGSLTRVLWLSKHNFFLYQELHVFQRAYIIRHHVSKRKIFLVGVVFIQKDIPFLVGVVLAAGGAPGPTRQ